MIVSIWGAFSGLISSANSFHVCCRGLCHLPPYDLSAFIHLAAGLSSGGLESSTRCLPTLILSLDSTRHKPASASSTGSATVLNALVITWAPKRCTLSSMPSSLLVPAKPGLYQHRLTLADCWC